MILGLVKILHIQRQPIFDFHSSGRSFSLFFTLGTNTCSFHLAIMGTSYMNTVRTMHAALIYASNAQHELIDPLLKLQKRAARLALDESMSTPSVDLFRKLEWIPIYNLIKMRKILLVVNTSSPSDLRELFCFSGASHDVYTRSSVTDLQIPSVKSNLSKTKLSYTEFYFSILHQMTWKCLMITPLLRININS